MSVLKHCNACGLDYTLETWRGLPLVGVQLFEYGEDELPAFELFEQRNCPCGSTLSRVLARDDEALFDLLAETERRRLDLAAGRKPHQAREDHHETSRNAWADWDAEEVRRELAREPS
jgi:hypothetical protein